MQVKIVEKEIKRVLEKKGMQINYQIGAMIEVPRAAILADELADVCDFFSFGTNDLTQLTFGFSRDDAAKFLKDYYTKKIFEQDPFATIDQEGVGKLVDKLNSVGGSAIITADHGNAELMIDTE